MEHKYYTGEQILEALSEVGVGAGDTSEVLSYLSGLPSAEPERKTGKWVNNINDMPICNQCGYMTPYDRAIDDYEYGNYCSNCGASMEVEDEAD